MPVCYIIESSRPRDAAARRARKRAKDPGHCVLDVLLMHGSRLATAVSNLRFCKRALLERSGKDQE